MANIADLIIEASKKEAFEIKNEYWLALKANNMQSLTDYLEIEFYNESRSENDGKRIKVKDLYKNLGFDYETSSIKELSESFQTDDVERLIKVAEIMPFDYLLKKSHFNLGEHEVSAELQKIIEKKFFELDNLIDAENSSNALDAKKLYRTDEKIVISSILGNYFMLDKQKQFEIEPTIKETYEMIFNAIPIYKEFEEVGRRFAESIDSIFKSLESNYKLALELQENVDRLQKTLDEKKYYEVANSIKASNA